MSYVPEKTSPAQPKKTPQAEASVDTIAGYRGSSLMVTKTAKRNIFSISPLLAKPIRLKEISEAFLPRGKAHMYGSFFRLRTHKRYFMYDIMSEKDECIEI
jgi:hypothetical protein